MRNLPKRPPMTDALSSQNDLGPVGDGEYLVVEGDCAESLAATSGLLPTTIWDHPKNAAVKKARDIQNLLLPGDRIHIPEKELKYQSCSTDRRHFFVRKGIPCKLRLCIRWCDKPRRDTPYILVVDGVAHNGKTDQAGCLEIPIRPDAATGQLTIGSDPLCQQVITLDLGAMDPITETVGIQKRLRNLGFLGDVTGELDDATASAIADFQENYSLEPTGELDQTTIDQLKTAYGC
jgi:Putative peptidoglycan binding domain